MVQDKEKEAYAKYTIIDISADSIRKELEAIKAFCKRTDLKEAHLWKATKAIYDKLGMKW